MSGDRPVTVLELVLRLHGEFRRRLEPIRVTPLQAGVMLYLHRCADARVTEAAKALRVKPPRSDTQEMGDQAPVGRRWPRVPFAAQSAGRGYYQDHPASCPSHGVGLSSDDPGEPCRNFAPNVPYCLNVLLLRLIVGARPWPRGKVFVAW